MTYFFSQIIHYIRAKLRHLERGPLTSQAYFLVLAFKVYHGRDEKVHKQKHQILTNAI